MSVIEVEGLTKNFNDIFAIRDLTFHIEEGEIFGYLGPNGAGKTTTIRLILGILKQDKGKIRLWGEPVTKEKLKKVGTVMEQDGLYNRLSCRENLRYWGEIFAMQKDHIERRMNELLEFMDLADRSKDPVNNLSKGMRRKLAIARALMHDPELLILDEPASGLDPEAQVMIRETLASLGKEGKTILLSSHNLADVEKIATKVAIIKKGELRMIEEIKDLKRTESVEIKVDDAEKAKGIIRADDLKEKGWLRAYGELSEIISALSGAGIRIEEVEKKEKTLEELYLEVIHE